MDLSGPIWDFCRTMGAVLAANLLTAAFLYAVIHYTRLEKEGRHETAEGTRHIGTILFVFAFLGIGLLAGGFIL